MRAIFVGVGLAFSLSCGAQAARTTAPLDYTHDAITVATPSRDATFDPTAACIVWENAEGLGVGPAQLDGFHGLSMSINPQPLAGEKGVATSFESGLAGLKAANPKAPGWMFAALERYRAPIEKGCEEDHPTPLLVHKLTAQDRNA